MPEIVLSLTPGGPPSCLVAPPSGPESYPDYVPLVGPNGGSLGMARIFGFTTEAVTYTIPEKAALPDGHSWSGDWRRLALTPDYLTLVELRQFHIPPAPYTGAH